MSHTIEHMYGGGLSSPILLNRILGVYKQQLNKCDMLLYETAANDYGSSVSLLAGTGRNSEEVEKTDRKNTLSMISSTELVIRSLWTFHSTLVIWIVAASWRCIGDSVMPPYYCSAAKGHLEVTQYYNVDHISVMHAMLPFTNEKYRLWIRQKFLLDGVHPAPLGHKMIAIVIAFALETEIAEKKVATVGICTSTNIRWGRQFA